MAFEFLVYRKRVYQLEDKNQGPFEPKVVKMLGSFSGFRDEIEKLAESLSKLGTVQVIDPSITPPEYELPTVPGVVVLSDGRPIYTHEIHKSEDVRAELVVDHYGGALHPATLLAKVGERMDADEREQVRSRVRIELQRLYSKLTDGGRLEPNEESFLLRSVIGAILKLDHYPLGLEVGTKGTEKEASADAAPQPV